VGAPLLSSSAHKDQQGRGTHPTSGEGSVRHWRPDKETTFATSIGSFRET
jgi:hypothetical protein